MGIHIQKLVTCVLLARGKWFTRDTVCLTPGAVQHYH